MNYLAHLLLSGDNSSCLIGNFIGDEVKGNSYLAYPPGIAVGIQLHRSIDTFTDTHPVVKLSKRRLQPVHGKFSGVILDVFYDYFLCQNWDLYCDQDFTCFIQDTYYLLQNNRKIMPKISQIILDKMVIDDWIGNYRNTAGIDRALKGLSKRTRYNNSMSEAITELTKYEDLFNEDFNRYFPDIIAHCKTYLQQHGKA